MRNEKRQQVSEKKKFIWNMTGSMCNALSSFVLLTIVTRVNGSEDGGIFSLAFSTAQMLTSIGCFESRAIQATDVRKKLEFKDYLTFRILTTIVMMLGLCGYVGFSGKTGEKAAVLFFITLYKAIDCISDSFQGLFQLENRIDLSGMALGIRVALSTAVFGITLLVTHHLVVASIMMCVTEVIFMSFFDIRISYFYAKPGIRFKKEKLFELFKECFPLFVGSFMFSYMVNASRYAIDRYMSDTIQNYYGFLLMPAFVINLFSLFFFRPLLTPMAMAWEEKDRKKFSGIIKKSMIWIGILTVGAVVGAYLLGIFFLNLLSGLDLSPYRIELVIVMLGGSMNAVITVLYYVLAVMRKQKWILIGYSIGFCVAIILTPFLVKLFGITGAVVAYVIPMAITAITFLLKSWVTMYKMTWSKKNE